MSQWTTISNDPSILNIVSGVKIEIIDDNFIAPKARPSVFNTTEHAIVMQEIDKLITKGAIIESTKESDDFISTIFLRLRKDGTHRMILNLKQFNENVVYHHF